MYFHDFVIISPWKRAGPFIRTNLNPLYPRMFCAKFDWNWPSGSGEEDENVKSLRQWRQRQRRRRTTDKFWSEKLTWAFGSGELKMWKVYRRTNRQTDVGRQVIRKAHLSFQLRWAKNGSKSKVKVTGSKIMIPTEMSYHKEYSCEISKL